MTTSNNINMGLQAPYLVTSRQFNQDQDLEGELTQSYIEIAQAVNRRTIGLFNTNQTVTGNRYYSTTASNPINSSQARQSYRQVFVFGAINAGATSTVSHGITGITQVVALYGNCTTAANVIANAKYKPIPFTSTTALNQQVMLYMNDTLITIVNGAGADNITSATVVVEYLLS